MTTRFALGSTALHIHRNFFWLPQKRNANVEDRNWFMFVQDLALRVIPYSVRDLESDEAVLQLEGSPSDIESAVGLLSRVDPDVSRHRPDESIERVARQVAERLAWTGRLLIDLREREPRNSGIRGAQECHDWWIPKIGRYFIQVALSRTESGVALHVAFVRRSQIMDVKVPPSLGGVWGYQMLRRRLDRFDVLGPLYWRRSLDAAQFDSQFDFTGYRRRASAYRDWVARHWGWSGRDTSVTLKTEFFVVLRHLRFLRACASLRQAILIAINNALARRGISARVVARRLPSAEEIGSTMDALVRGEITMGEAYKRAGVG